MLEKFRRIFEAPPEDRRGLFEDAGSRFGTLASYAEKDFWVCLTLEILFNHRSKDDPQLLFKGGTSLSKVYGVINRFSEDIDTIVFPEDLGMNLNELRDLGSKKRKRFFERLSERCDEYLYGPLVDILKDKISEAGAAEFEVVPDEEHTILIHYPSLFQSAGASYVKPAVKIESGARSATVPHESRTVRPYAEIPEVNLEVQNVCTIKAERTFCDKMIILHGLRSGFDKKDRIPSDQNRASRHYYDLAQMFRSGVADLAINDLELLEDARRHASLAFPSAWRDYDTAVPGSFRLVPRGELLDVLKSDYGAMRGVIFGEVPTFGEILSSIQELEERVNG